MVFNKRICKSKRRVCSLQKKIRYTKTKEESIQKTSVYKRIDEYTKEKIT